MKLPSRRFAAALLGVSAILAGCASSPPVHYYTLVEKAPAPAMASQSGQHVLIDVAGVTVPPQADQPQIMVREASGAVTALYSERWSSPLGDEVRTALSDSLVRSLGAIDVQTVRPAADAPVWRIQVDVQRFDTSLSEGSLLDATWRVRPINLNGSLLLCSARVRVPTRDGSVQAVVDAHQRAVAQLALTIGSAIRSDGRAAQPASDQVQLLACKQGQN